MLAWRAGFAAAAVVAAVAGGLLPAGEARAQPQVPPEQVARLYEETLTQLKAAQDRKSELAAENEKLAARVGELEKQLRDARVELAEGAARTFELRAHYAAWQRFVGRYPDLLARWTVYLERDPLSAPGAPAPTTAPAPFTPLIQGGPAPDDLFDRDWPLSAQG